MKFSQLLAEYLEARDEWLRLRGSSGKYLKAQALLAEDRMRFAADALDRFAHPPRLVVRN